MIFYDLFSNTFIGTLYRSVKLDVYKIRWRMHNEDNETELRNAFNMSQVSVGKKSYGGIRVISYGNLGNLRIGNYVSIGLDTTFILNAEHRTDTASTYPFRVKVVGDNHVESFPKGNIIVDDDVWIGLGVTILSGVHIGQGAVIGAGSLVTNDVPPYAVVGGNPSKVIKYRFSDDIIDFLTSLDYSKLEESTIKNKIEILYTSLDGMDLESIKKMFEWFPKKVKDE